MEKQTCFCGSSTSFSKCCQAIIDGVQSATTAESLMRSRYVAYVIHNADYLMDTTHPSQKELYSKDEILLWATSNQWQRLEICKASTSTVDFKAYYTNSNNELQIHQEHSRFVFENGKWWYLDGDYFEN
jgi:SEC-C motif domain protein